MKIRRQQTHSSTLNASNFSFWSFPIRHWVYQRIGNKAVKRTHLHATADEFTVEYTKSYVFRCDCHCICVSTVKSPKLKEHHDWVKWAKYIKLMETYFFYCRNLSCQCNALYGIPRQKLNTREEKKIAKKKLVSK